jgi:hypothetical protein
MLYQVDYTLVQDMPTLSKRQAEVLHCIMHTPLPAEFSRRDLDSSRHTRLESYRHRRGVLILRSTASLLLCCYF